MLDDERHLETRIAVVQINQRSISNTFQTQRRRAIQYLRTGVHTLVVAGVVFTIVLLLGFPIVIAHHVLGCLATLSFGNLLTLALQRDQYMHWLVA